MGRLAWCDLGRVGYATARRVQEQLAARRVRGEAPDVVLVVEHPPIVTVGRGFGRSRGAGDTPPPVAGLPPSWTRVDRGGGPTYHGPGQLVIYPVIALRGRGVRSFVCALERSLCDVARAFGVTATTHRAGLPGAWVEHPNGWRKIGSIGLAVRRGVTLHGAALNVAATAEAGFAGFSPCAIEGAAATSIETETGRAAPPLAEVSSALARGLAAHAGFSGAELRPGADLGIDDLAPDAACPGPSSGPGCGPASETGEAAAKEGSEARAWWT